MSACSSELQSKGYFKFKYKAIMSSYSSSTILSTSSVRFLLSDKSSAEMGSCMSPHLEQGTFWEKLGNISSSTHVHLSSSSEPYVNCNVFIASTLQNPVRFATDHCQRRGEPPG